MEGVSLKDNSESKSEVPMQKKPIVAMEFVQTPQYLAARDRKSNGPKESAAESSQPDLSNSNFNENRNPLLEESYLEVQQQQRTQMLIQLGVTGLILGGYLAWKWGWLKWPNSANK